MVNFTLSSHSNWHSSVNFHYSLSRSPHFIVQSLLLNAWNQLKIKHYNRGDMRKIHMTWQFFEASDRRRHFFKQKNVFTYGLGECVPNFRSVYIFNFFFGQEVPYKPINIFTSELKNIFDRVLASRGFW